jgi:signal transduction histidine kinase
LTQLYTFLAQGYAAQNKMDAAFEAMQKLDGFRDSLEYIATESDVARLTILYALDKSNIELRNVAQRAEVARKQFYAGIGVLLFGLAALTLIIWLISKNKRQTEKLNAQLAGQNALKDRLFASIGHDLRSPLAQSYAALRILRRKLQGMPEIEEGLTRVQAGQGHALQVTDDLLGWVALQWGGETQLTAVDVNEVVGQVVLLNRSALDDKQLQLQLPDEAPPKVKSDAQAVALLVRNFLTNAIKFSPASATITFGWGLAEGRPWLSISDAGKGFPADWLGDLQDLAARNERLPSEQGSAGETGTGFGLMLCATFAKQIGATVLLEAPAGGGARVKIEFPPMN